MRKIKHKKFKSIYFLIGLILIPTISFAQLDDDGKSYKSKKVKNTQSLYSNTLLYSAAISCAPFGIRYQYLSNKVGLFLNVKSDFDLIADDFIFAAGPSFRINDKINGYIGGGYNIGYYKDIDAEAGVIIKRNKFAIDIGIGYSAEIAYITFGFGFNF